MCNINLLTHSQSYGINKINLLQNSLYYIILYSFTINNSILFNDQKQNSYANKCL